MNKNLATKDAKEASPERRLIIGGDGLDIALANYEFDEKKRKLRDFLTKKFYRVKDTDASYRTINHWASLGLLDDTRAKDSNWRAFSITELVWIKIIAKLRSFGFPLERIAETKRWLFYAPLKPDVKYPLLEVHILYALSKDPCVLVVFQDGFCQIGRYDMYDISNRGFGGLESHILINLNDVVREIFSKVGLEPIYDIPQKLTDKEFELLNIIRSGDYTEVKVRFKDRKLDLLELKQEKPTEKRIIEILKEAKFQDIKITTMHGKIISIQNTIRRKL